MRIQVNGESKEIPEACSLAALIEFLELPAERLAVERNLSVVRRPDWPQVILQDGDRLEIVHFVGGG